MNLFNMAKDLKGMEKMMKPALEKFMKDSGFVKKEELTKLENSCLLYTSPSPRD